MDLWIRSQDKLKLLKADNIKIKFETEEVLMTTYYTISIYVDGEEVGNYKTEKRALEILDEIQRIFSNGLQANNNNQICGTTTYVYEMPKE